MFRNFYSCPFFLKVKYNKMFRLKLICQVLNIKKQCMFSHAMKVEKN